VGYKKDQFVLEVVGMKFKVALVALAVVCLLVGPATSMPSGKGCKEGNRGGIDEKNSLYDNLTREQLDNMTLGQLRELQDRGSGNRTGWRTEMAGSNRSNGEGHAAASGQNGACPSECQGMKGCGIDHGNAGQSIATGEHILLLTDDLTAEKLRNMTINQILELKKTKMQQFDNMTSSQIRELRVKKIEEENNMTLAEASAARNESMQAARILNMVSDEGHGGRHNARA
jgi:hypothetical protein